VHEGQVEVAGVPELGPAQAAEGHDRERQLRLERGERCFERGLGQPREVGAHDVDGGVAEHVARTDAQDVPLLPALQRALALVAVGAPGHRRVGTGHQLLPAPRLQALGVRQPVDEVGVGAQHLAEPAARAEEEREVAGHLGGVAEGAGQRPRAGLARCQPAQAQQAEVRVGSRRQPPSSSGSSCCIIRDDRVSPRVSSVTA